MADFCRLLLTFVNSMDAGLVQQNVGPVLDQICLMPSDGIPQSIFNKKLKELNKECQVNKITKFHSD